MDLIPSPLLIPSFEVAHLAGPAAGALSGFAFVALRHAPVLIVIGLLHLCQSAAASESGDEEERCSKSLGFNESQGPKDRNAQDLQFCNEHHKRTCCDKDSTRQVLTYFATFSHQQSSRCVQMSRLGLCAYCDADVGIGIKSELNHILMCPTFCKRWYDACKEDFFAPASSGGVHPCGPSALVCSPLQEIHSDSAAFCSGVVLTGVGATFSVADSEDEQDSPCFDGVPSARIKGKGPKAAYARARRETTWRMWFSQQYTRFINKIPYSLHNYIPSMIVACLALLLTIYLWKSD